MWTISRVNSNSEYTFYVDSDGYVNDSYRVSSSYGIYPSFSLETSAAYIGGTGTQTDPYRIA